MNQNIVSAVFDSRDEAERAVNDLRGAGISDSAISIVAQQDGGHTTTTDGSGEEVAKDVVGSAALGAGAGALLGIAALAIPGVGPFVAAGAIAQAAVGGAAVTGTVIGAAAGGLAGALEDHGVSREDATYYQDRVTDGGIFVSVDTAASGVDAQRASDMLYAAGGHSASRTRATV
jgi:uncharacterized membrane protein